MLNTNYIKQFAFSEISKKKASVVHNILFYGNSKQDWEPKDWQLIVQEPSSATICFFSIKFYWITATLRSNSVSDCHTMTWLSWQGLWPTKPKSLPILPYTLKRTSKCLPKSRLQFSFVMFRKITIFSDLPFPRFCKMMLFSLHIEWVWKSNVIESGWESTCTLRITVDLGHLLSFTWSVFEKNALHSVSS